MFVAVPGVLGHDKALGEAMTALHAQLTHIVKTARAAGLTSLDLYALEDLLHDHQPGRPDLVRPGEMLVVTLDD